ncbi:MAG: rRNA maturation RNase YbeY [Bacillota bacterium]|nr:rRNA maturation RNase YbeY [Bacillota bacterium]
MELIFNECDLPEKAVTDKMEKAAALCLAREGIEAENVEISVSFVSEEEIKELNSVYRNNNSVTDVLSFPQYDDLTRLGAFPGDDPEEEPEDDAEEPYVDYDDEAGEIALGDVVICTDRARQQAEEFGHSFERELVYLFVHSMFHLLGYDHMEPEEKSEMRQAEEEIMGKLDLAR